MADVWIKFCGCTASSDVVLAADAGADAFGMIFAPSPRRVTWQAADDIARAVCRPQSSPSPSSSIRRAVKSRRCARSFRMRGYNFPATKRPEFVARYGERTIKTIHVDDD